MNLKLLIRRGMLVVWDIILINIATYFALLLRFDFSIEKVNTDFLKNMFVYAPFMTIISLLVFVMFHLYSSLWRFAGVMELMNVIMACATSCLLQAFIMNLMGLRMPRSYYPLCLMILIILIGGERMAYRMIRRVTYQVRTQKSAKIMIIGAGDAGNLIIKEIVSSNYLNGKVVCVIDDDKHKKNHYIQGVRVVGNRYNIPEAVEKYMVTDIILAIPSVDISERKKILEICQTTDCKLKTLPGIYQLINNEVSVSRIRDVEIEDLLGRDSVRLNTEQIMGYVSGKVVMVTGGGGSIGSELCRQIVKHQPKQLIIVDIYENNAYEIEQELRREYPKLNLVTLIASVRNTKRMDQIFEIYQPQLVYHAAAHKHVPLMENSPNEAVKNNVGGTWKLVKAADKHHVQRFVQISTDKAVNPTNVMGATKRICEMMIQLMNHHSDTEFVAVRFGNVLGSNGSVIPLFKKQIMNGGPVTVTHPDIIRYFMTIPEAVSLVLEAGALAKGGEIFVLEMGEPVKIVDLAKNLIRLSGYTPGEDIKIVYTGLRPGEKLYEELLMDEEGLLDTPNRLIHIGKPIPMEEEKFQVLLEELLRAANEEDVDIRSKLKEIVPTYHPKEA